VKCFSARLRSPRFAALISGLNAQVVPCYVSSMDTATWGGNVTARKRRVSPPTGLVSLVHNFPRASAPGLDSFAPPGLGFQEDRRAGIHS
jgi:hypothetical protein